MWFIQVQRNTTFQPSVKLDSRYVMLNSNIVNIGHALSSNNACVNSQVTLKAAQLFKSQMSSLCMCKSWYFNYVVCGALITTLDCVVGIVLMNGDLDSKVLVSQYEFQYQFFAYFVFVSSIIIESIRSPVSC